MWHVDERRRSRRNKERDSTPKMPEMRMMPYISDCGHIMDFEEEVLAIRSITRAAMTFIHLSMYPPRICEKCGDVMRRVMEE
jgi:hypothetical protein